MLTVNQAFHQFIGDLELTENQRQEASRQQNVLRDNLRKHIHIARDILSGSYSRRTAIRPLNDIDLFVILDEAAHGGLRSKEPIAALDLVKGALEKSYQGKEAPTLQGRSVNIFFSGTGIGYDVVPAFAVGNKDEPDLYIIPDRARKNWIKTNPEMHKQACVAANARAGSKLNALIKAAKHWNRQKGKPLRSFHIEVMAYGAFSAGPASYPEGLRDLFKHLSTAVLSSCPEPAGVGPNIDAGMAQDERNRIRAQLVEAHDQATKAVNADAAAKPKEAHQIWRALFGNAYPETGK